MPDIAIAPPMKTVYTRNRGGLFKNLRINVPNNAQA